MTAREKAIGILKQKGYVHIIYGYRAKGETVETSWEHDMKKFNDDDTFAGYIDKMQAEIDGLEMILAVHQR